MVKTLTKDERKALYDQNVRIGRYAIWVKGLTNPAHWPWRALLWGLWHDVDNARDRLPTTEAVVVEMPEAGWGVVGADFYAMLGFVPVELYNPRGKPHLVYVRVDALDHVSNALWSAVMRVLLPCRMVWVERLSCSDAMMKRIVNALGFKQANERDIGRAKERAKQKAQRDAAERKACDRTGRKGSRARKAELLAKEVVAAEGMELTPDQVLAAAGAKPKPLNFNPVLTCLLAPRSRLNQQLRRVKRLPVTVTGIVPRQLMRYESDSPRRRSCTDQYTKRRHRCHGRAVGSCVP